MAMSKRITFWTTFVRLTNLYYPDKEWKGEGGGGSDLTSFENRVFRPPKMVQKIIFRRSDKNKSCYKLNFEWFWAKKVKFWMKLTIWGGVSDLTPSPRRSCGNQNPPKSRWRRGPKGGPHKIKSAQNYYLGIVKKFQINRISHFLTVDFQKMEVRSDPPPRPE